MRFVLDTNVLVSALIKSGKPQRIPNAVLRPNHTLILSEPIIEEFSRVTADEKIERYADDEAIAAYLGVLLARAIFVRPKSRVRVFNDPDDNVLSTAKEGDADFIVTGDKHMLGLKEFKGILVSDFYGAYDAIQCPQQKCLIHLIRDLNDDLLKFPYDEEFRQLAQAFALLLKPMIASVDRHGLKSRFLKRHLVSVERFYREMSKRSLRSETAVKFKERLRNRNKLFTFLSHDNIPWNNNNAEHAVKAFAALRRVIAGVTTEKGLREYLVLLTLCETCKYMGMHFLDFLRSDEKDIQAFASIQHRRRRWFGGRR